MTTEEKINELAEMFEVEAPVLTPETELGTLNWDSMAKLSFIALVKGKFDKMVSGEMIRGMKTIADLLSVMG